MLEPEQFSMELKNLNRKPIKAKVDIISQWELRVKTGKLLKARESASDQILVLNLIDWVGGASFWTSHSEVKQV